MRTTPQPNSTVSALKLALISQELRSTMEGIDLLRSEPIAVVGMACRFPGGADSPEQFWELLEKGVDAIREVPSDRFDVNRYYDPDPSARGKLSTRFGGFIDDPYGFDANFFGISPREAAAMDPQQRVFLEVAIEALDDAGYTRQQLSGTATGVFAASYYNDYYHILTRDLQTIDAYTISGTTHAMVSNRLSFLLNLRGPSLTIDTACSSSLVTIHQACESLRRRETDLAISGGVNLILAPVSTLTLSKWGFMAKDGRCKTFDARADGFVRSEGCGVVVLKRLSDALTAGDRLLAVVRGSAVNQDGHSTVLTAPNGLAQQAVIRQALDNARVSPAQISYIEAHGTGTIIGDPIEVEALIETLGSVGAPAARCAIASVKTNIGHCEAAAGIAGFIKTVLCLQHGVIPPHLHLQHLNPHITLEKTRFFIPQEVADWQPQAQRRFAGVSSFGFGGTNAHVVLEEAPHLPQESLASTGEPYLLPISARSPQALRELASTYQRFLSGRDPESIGDICYTASLHRSPYEYRLAVAGRDSVELTANLARWLESQEDPPATSIERPKVGFIFSGQGTQWPGMGSELFETQPAFRQAVEQIDALIKQLAGWSVVEEITRPTEASRLGQTRIAQPALFAIQVGLDALWRSWGIAPDGVTGHSLGEIAAAYSAGALNLELAVHLVLERGGLMQAVEGQGKMASVELSESEAAQAIAPYGERLSVAAINSPTTCVISGESQDLEAALELLRKRGVRVKSLAVNYAFHSTQVIPAAEALERRMDGMAGGAPSLPFYSTVFGGGRHLSPLNAGYWGDNIRRPVRFAQSISAMLKDGFTTFIEVGAHPALAGMVHQCCEEAGAQGNVLVSMRKGSSQNETMLIALGESFVKGLSPRWEALFSSNKGKVVPLPRYPWQHQLYRKEETQPALEQGRASSFDFRPLRSPSFPGSLYPAEISLAAQPYLSDHRIHGVALLPAAGSLDMILRAAGHELEARALTLQDVAFLEPIVLSEAEALNVQIHLKPMQDDRVSFEMFSRGEENDWKTCVTGRVVHPAPSQIEFNTSLSAILAACSEKVDVEEFYARRTETGVDFGPAFQRIQEIWRGEEGVLARVQNHGKDYQGAQSWFHPTLLDACLQPVNAFVSGEAPYLPVRVDRFTALRPAGDWLWSYVTIERPASGDGNLRARLVIFDENGEAVALVEGLHLKRSPAAALHHILAKPVSQLLHEAQWQPIDQPTQDGKWRSRPGQAWLVLADEGGVGDLLTRQLTSQSQRPLIVFAGKALSRRAEGVWEIEPTQPQNWQQLFQELHDSVGPLAGIIHLWSLDQAQEEQMTPSETQPGTAGALLALVQALQSNPATGSGGLLVVTRGAQPLPGEPASGYHAATLWGMAAALRVEAPELNLRCLDMDPEAGLKQVAAQVLEEMAPEEHKPVKVAWRQERRLTEILAPARVVPVSTPVRLETFAQGLLENLRLQPLERRPPARGEVEVQVRAAGLNFRDVLKALGRYPDDSGPLGDECAGVIVAVGAGVDDWQVGDRIAVFAPGTFASYVTAPAERITRIPKSMSFEEAAGTSIVYMTALYCLEHLAKLAPGETVLIHASAGGVGLAALQIARQIGARVFATAGSEEKRSYVRSCGAEQVFDSRSTAFVEEIRTLTDGRGVDVILNSLSGDFIPASFSALAENGRFIEIGRAGIWSQAEAVRVHPTAVYRTVYLKSALDEQAGLYRRLMEEIFARLTSGKLRQMPRHEFALADAQAAFRFMAAGRHTGKIVLLLPGERPLSPKDPDRFRQDATYLITGGLSGLGLETARWMAGKGAGCLVLAGRRGVDTPGAPQAIEELQSLGARVEVFASDIARASEAERLLEAIRAKLPPLRGIIHAAGCLEDGIVKNQNWDRYARVMAPKLDGAWNLHRFSRYDALDFFVLFSALAGTIGTSGQSGYVAANSFLDSFSAWRRSQGLPALALDWGPWAETGMFARLSPNEQGRIVERGLQPLKPTQALAALGVALSSPHFRLLIYQTRPGSTLVEAESVQNRSGQPGASPSSKRGRGLLERWEETPASGRRALLLAYLSALAMRVIGLTPGKPIDPRMPYHDIGLDSLMAVEMRNALALELQTSLPSTLLFDYPTGAALADFLTQSVPALQAARSEQAAPAQQPTQIIADDQEQATLENMSEEDASAQLMAELEKSKKRN